MDDYIKKMVAMVAVTVGFCAGVHAAPPSSEQFREAAQGFIRQEKTDEGMAKMTDYISRRVAKVSRVSARELKTLAVTAECVRFMKLSASCPCRPETKMWILGQGQRLHLLIDTLEPQDRFNKVMQTLERLRDHDSDAVERYFDLALAIAVVMDNKLPRMHGQMGRDVLAYKPNPVARFDYFKTLYGSGTSKIAYEKLGVRELVFVVHAPVPESELQWALGNVDEKLGAWGDNYSSIIYNHARLESSRFSWDEGTYTLASIRELGGICVDQAYYSVITARAFGIPSIYFRGAGNSCNHAWFAFMERPGEWHLGIGRYGSESYTTGYALNPQTGRQMTDHDVEFTCERSLHSAKAAQASVILTIARVLEKSDPIGALKCIKQSRALVKRYLPSWELEQKILTRQKDYDALVKLYDEQKDAFRKYPYILAGSAEILSKTLKKAGRSADADGVMKQLSGVLSADQDDLAYSIERQEIDSIIASGDMKKARKKMEQMLEQPEFRGNKSFGMMTYYVAVTKKTGQSKRAVDFLEDYIPDLVRNYNFPPSYEAKVWELLSLAYMNNDDHDDAEKLLVRIEYLKTL